jgi:hypothetical protein
MDRNLLGQRSNSWVVAVELEVNDSANRERNGTCCSREPPLSSDAAALKRQRTKGAFVAESGSLQAGSSAACAPVAEQSVKKKTESSNRH